MMRDRSAIRGAVVVAVVLAAVLTFLFMWLTRGDTESDASETRNDHYPELPETVVYADEANEFESLGVLTASSDLVVRGTVLGAGPGEKRDFDDPHGPITHRLVGLRVEAVVYNPSRIAVPTEIVLIEGFWQDGVGVARSGMPWSQAGDTGYFYLSAEPDRRAAGPYSYVSSSSRVLIGTEGVRPSGDRGSGPWRSLTASSSSSVVDKVVGEGVMAARQGSASPAPELPTYEPEGSKR